MDKKIIGSAFIAAAIVTALIGLVYGAVQQDMREGANDPQIQMAEDAARVLERGGSPDDVLPPDDVDMGTSLAPFLVVLGENGDVLAASVSLEGATPVPPKGVLDAAKASGENRITWQPRPGVRSAIIVVPYAGSNPGFVVAGRSLREVEKREGKLTGMVAGVWLFSMIAILVFTVPSFRKKKQDA